MSSCRGRTRAARGRSRRRLNRARRGGAWKQCTRGWALLRGRVHALGSGVSRDRNGWRPSASGRSALLAPLSRFLLNQAPLPRAPGPRCMKPQSQRGHEEHDRKRRRRATQKGRGTTAPEQGLARTGSERARESASLARLEQDRSHQCDTYRHVQHDDQRYQKAGHPDWPPRGSSLDHETASLPRAPRPGQSTAGARSSGLRRASPIARKESAVSEAPPTRNPSTSAIAASAPAFLASTLPP